MTKDLSKFSESWLKKFKRSYIQMLIIFYLSVNRDATGYVITETLKTRLDSLFTISAGSVYPQLNKLEEDGLVKSEIKFLDIASVRPNEPRKVYNLTNYGLSILTEIKQLWNELFAITHMFLEEFNLIKDENDL